MHNNRPLTDFNYRARFRQLKPSGPGCSVNTLTDTELTSGQGIILPVRYDHPMLCFRLEKFDGGFHFVHTDKTGTKVGSYAISKDFEVVVEYLLKVQTLRLFKHEIRRMFVMPHTDEGQNILEQLFRIQQGGKEKRFGLMFIRAEEVRVSL